MSFPVRVLAPELLKVNVGMEFILLAKGGLSPLSKCIVMALNMRLTCLQELLVMSFRFFCDPTTVAILLHFSKAP